MSDIPPCFDPDHEGNGPEHRTGNKCIEPGCDQPAGTAWGKLWCFSHNVERIKRIDAQMEAIERRLCPTVGCDD